MTASKHAIFTLWALIAMLLLAIAGCGGNGETTTGPDENAPTPAITSVDPQSAAIGDQVTISGLNFGAEQSGGTVKLNGVDFAVVSWSDTQIVVTVVAGMTSGIVVVTKNGNSSQNGQEAQLFIPNSPATTPVIFTLSPAYGRIGTDIITIVGSGFGSEQGNNRVYFSYDPATYPDPARYDLSTGPNSEPLVSDKVLLPGGAIGVMWLNLVLMGIALFVAVRYGVQGATLTTLFLTLSVTMGTVWGFGPFPGLPRMQIPAMSDRPVRLSMRTMS